MISRLRDEAGLTLVEVVATCGMLVGVLGATLSALAEFDDTTRLNTLQNEAQQEARHALTSMASELRNLASPTNELPNAVEKAEPRDFVFQSVGADRPGGSLNERNTLRVRYCLATETGKLWRQEQTWTAATAPALPATDVCPAPGQSGQWSAPREVARTVTNGTARPVFTYNSATLTRITEVRGRLYVDVNPAARPRETDLETSIFLRNQNRAPTAVFTATVNGTQIILNGSDSTDPEGKALSYFWYDGGTYVGEGITRTYTPAQSGSHTMTLTVRDPAGLEHVAPAQTVCVIGTTPC